MPLTQDERDDITAAMLGVIDRYCGADPADMPLVRELAAETCRIIEARERAQLDTPDFACLGMRPPGWRSFPEKETFTLTLDDGTIVTNPWGQ